MATASCAACSVVTRPASPNHTPRELATTVSRSWRVARVSGWSGPSTRSRASSTFRYSVSAAARLPCSASKEARLWRVARVSGWSGPSTRSRASSTFLYSVSTAAWLPCSASTAARSWRAAKVKDCRSNPAPVAQRRRTFRYLSPGSGSAVASASASSAAIYENIENANEHGISAALWRRAVLWRSAQK